MEEKEEHTISPNGTYSGFPKRRDGPSFVFSDSFEQYCLDQNRTKIVEITPDGHVSVYSADANGYFNSGDWEPFDEREL